MVMGSLVRQEAVIGRKRAPVDRGERGNSSCASNFKGPVPRGDDSGTSSKAKDRPKQSHSQLERSDGSPTHRLSRQMKRAATQVRPSVPCAT
ncbi:hypothetical protein JZ751_021437 [Albula glossodonta]|uniref:Uncharacterized protein n=1 Tax=Albula glossodonta TaxID=121402 RepID=A0A8T2MUS4_9TELE|nr:hypothetical protein JZ751_021437 [Albula glossodonta]